MYHGLTDERELLREQVAGLLGSLDSGVLPAKLEWEKVDLKEEPGRRGAGGILLPGELQNLAAADYLAKEVCCFANSPGGGALILGVEDGTGQLLGTSLDSDWLRNRIFQMSDIAPAIEEHHVAGQRVLALYIAPVPEPIEDRDGKIRWRVGDNCQPVDRAEWWVHQESRGRVDTMATATHWTLDDVSAGALQAARGYLASAGDDATAQESGHQLLTRVGALTPGGQLTQAGVLLFCNSDRRLITLARFDAVGGLPITAWEAKSPMSLLEQLSEVEVRLDAFNGSQVIPFGSTSEVIRNLPTGSIREAVLNGLMHRDWHLADPTSVEWVDVDSRLTVTSPGGFSGGITENNVLTSRHSRSPALSDLFRALRLVDKQGVGVDRMYREMISLGHRPPHIRQLGPSVQTLLVGGAPVIPVMHLMAAIRPTVRQRDVRIAILVNYLLQQPFVTSGQAARELQTSEEDARTALDAAATTTVSGKPLVEIYKDAWILSGAAIALVLSPASPTQLPAHAIVPYFRAKQQAVRKVVSQWLDIHEQITSGDLTALTRTAQPNSSRQLGQLEGDLLSRGGDTRGRNAHFLKLVVGEGSGG